MSAQTVGVSYHQHEFDESWDAIVIGSGIGGLTAAALRRNLFSVVTRHT